MHNALLTGPKRSAKTNFVCRFQVLQQGWSRVQKADRIAAEPEGDEPAEAGIARQGGPVQAVEHREGVLAVDPRVPLGPDLVFPPAQSHEPGHEPGCETGCETGCESDHESGCESGRESDLAPDLPPGLPRKALWRVAVYWIVSLRLYEVFWLYFRLEPFNMLRSECKLWPWLFYTALGLGLASGLFSYPPEPALAHGFGVAETVLSVASGLTYMFLLFCGRAALQDHMEAAGLPLGVNRWLLLVLGFIYLQYAINRAHDRIAAARTHAPGVANPAECG